MKKLYLSIVLALLMLVSLSLVPIKADSPVGTTFDFSYQTKFGSGDPVVTDLGTKTYGSTVSVDPGTNVSYEFSTYVVNGKAESNLPRNTDFIITSDLDVKAYYKPNGTFAVIFMDSNQDLLDIQYVASGASATPPSTAVLAKPGFEVDSPAWMGDYTNVTEDTLCYIQYSPLIADTYTLSLTNGTSDKSSYNFNEVATVTASGTGNFQYWENGDYEIVSLNPVYSFTVVEDNMELTAVYDADTASPNADTLFINLESYRDIITDYTTFVGQFVLPAGNDLVEYGILASDYDGGITFDTPDVNKIRANKYNPDTLEFVGSLPSSIYDGKTVRAYMVTTDGVDETITYSDIAIFADDLFISEYIEGSSNNKAIEIYNGTGYDVLLSDYDICVYSNGSSTASNTISLSGTLAAGDVFVVANSSAAQAIKDETDLLSGSLGFNGDDAVSLKREGANIDVVGVIGDDPGSYWELEGGNTLNHTLVRSITPNGSTSNQWNPKEWSVYEEDTFSKLGWHKMDTEPTTLTISGTNSIMVGETTDLDVAQTTLDASKDVIWYSNDELLATVDADGVVTGVAEGSVTIYAFSFWNHSIYSTYLVTVTEPVTYTVTYEENGGTTVSDESSVLEGSKITAPDPASTKTGYKFNGWFTDDSTFTNEWDFDVDTVTADTTLYAQWLEEFDLSFNSNGGSAVLAQVVADGELATEPTDPTKTDKVFAGWFTDDGVWSDRWIFTSDTVTADTTLYAKWDDANSGSLMIYEIYGGGGNSGSTYKNDYIVLYNSTSSSIDLTGYSVQYASSTGTTWTVTTLSGSIGAGQYYLIKENAGSGGTTELPTPDATGSISMSGTKGKVALVSSTTALSGSDPSGDSSVVDFVGYGSADAYEGTGPTPAPSNTNSVQRNSTTDTDDNANDFDSVTTDLSYLE